MFETKYVIMISIVIALLFAYYCYDEISTMKKLTIPTYQKTMQLESKIIELERKSENSNKLRAIKPKKQIDSPIYSITYQSELATRRKKNKDIVYQELSDNEVSNIRKNIINNSSEKKSKNNSSEKKLNESLHDVLEILSSPSPIKINTPAEGMNSNSESIFDSKVAKHISDSMNYMVFDDDDNAISELSAK